MAILKNKSKVKLILKPLDVVGVWVLQDPCSQTYINDVLECAHRDKIDVEEMIKIETLENMKAWLALMIGIPAPSWLRREPLL